MGPSWGHNGATLMGDLTMPEVVKLNVRLSLELREDAGFVAAAMGVSLNTFIVRAIEGRVTWAVKNVARAKPYTRPDLGPDTSSTTVVFEGITKVRSSIAKVGADQPCPCGSRDKYKRCHGKT
jgi:hypothetical protein